MSGESINVFVRVRPPLEAETLSDKSEEVVDVLGPKTISVASVRSSYDLVFGGEATQEEVYEAIKPSVEAVATGVNCTIFAYGQTGSGKTHTMLGTDLEESLLEEDDFAPTDTWGIIPRAVDDLFLLLAEHAAEGTTATVHCAYMQIYNDKIYDLLQDRKRRRPLQIREITKSKKRREVYVQNLAEYRVSSAEDVLMLLQQGGRNRAVRGTEYNEASSRSHALLQVSVEVETEQEGGSTVLRRAKLNMVDLAGSEKWNTKLSLGSRRAKELTHINQSLSALGNCIAALTEKKRLHVPYRDSKLTRLLQDSLGGNTRTTVIATLGPMSEHKDESVSTLLFADRASRVVTRVRRNEVVDDAVLLSRAQREISRLRTLLNNNDMAKRLDELEREVSLLTAENKKLRAQLRHETNHGTSFRAAPSADLGLPQVKGATSIEDGGSGGGAVAPATPRTLRAPRYRSPQGVSKVGPGAGAGAGAGAGSASRRQLFHKTSASSQQAMEAAYSSPRGGASGRANGSRGSSAGGPRRTSKPARGGRRAGSAKKPGARAGQKRSASGGVAKTAGSSRQRSRSQVEASAVEDDAAQYVDEADPENEAEDEDEIPDDDVIEQLRLALQSEGAGGKTVMRLAADAEEQCGRELEGLLHSVDTIAAERKLLEQQLASLQDGLMRQTNDYLAEGRRQRASRRSSRNNSRSSSRQPSRQRGPKRKPKPASLTNTTGRPVSPLQSPATAAGSYPPSVPTTPGLQGPARGFTYSKLDVGATISLYSSRYDEWSEGRVMAYDGIRKMHLVVYVNGDRKWHMLKKDKKFKVLVASPLSKNQPPPDVPTKSLKSSKRTLKLKPRSRPRLDHTVRTGPAATPSSGSPPVMPFPDSPSS